MIGGFRWLQARVGSFATVRPNGKPGHVRYATEVGISGIAA
jgi:hypothetical protein